MMPTSDEDKTKKQLIEELKALRAELAQEKALSNTIINHMPDLIYVKDSESRFIKANQAVADLMGVKNPDDLKGKRDTDFPTLATAEKFFEDEKTIIETGEPLINEEEINTYPSGEKKWVLASKVPLRNENGEIIGLVGINRDITRYKIAEEDLEKERNLFYAVMDHLPDQVYVKDTDSRFIRVSLQTAKDMGANSPSEMIGKSDFDYLPEWRAQRAYDEERELIRTGNPVKDLELDTRDNHWLLIKKVPLIGMNGKIVGLVGINRDITKYKFQEARLKREHKLLRTLIDNIPDYIYVKDVNSSFVIANATAVRRLGAREETELIGGNDVGGKTDFHFFPLEYAAKYFLDEQKIIETGIDMVSQEERIIDIRTKKRGWLSTTKVPLRDEKGKIIGIVGIGRDITELKEALDQEQKRSKQREALRDTLLAMASSLELRPLLNFIVAEAVRLLDARSGGLYQYYPKRAELKLVAEKDRPEELGDVVKEGKGIAGRLVQYKGKMPYLFVPNYSTWAYQIPQHAETGKLGAVLAVNLEWQKAIIGVLYVEYEVGKRFNMEDIEFLQLFANQAAIVIQNASLFETRTELALKGLIHSAPRHNIKQRAIKIRDAITSIEGYVEKKGVIISDEYSEKFMKMQGIAETASREIISLNPLFRPLSKHIYAEINAKKWIQTESDKYRHSRKYPVTVNFNRLSDSVTIQVDPDWLSCVWQILIDNAEEAMAKSKVKRFMIMGCSSRRWVTVDFRDTGLGIMEYFLPMIFKQKISDSMSGGMGLIMADLIVRTYGGEISVHKTGVKGTTMRLRIPIKNPS